MNKPIYRLIQSSKWTRALVESLAALLLCIVIVGAFFLPNEFKKQQELPQKQVVSCCLSKDAKTVIALVATEHRHQPGNRILQVSTNSDQPTIRDITPDLKPECLVLEPTGWRMFVGDSRGSIHDVRSVPNQGAPLTVLAPADLVSVEHQFGP